MASSLSPHNLRLYRDIARLLLRYGRSDLVRAVGLEEVLTEDQTEAMAPDAQLLAKDLEELGPTFIKLGQLLWTRTDLLPVPYLEALARLQDRVEAGGCRLQRGGDGRGPVRGRRARLPAVGPAARSRHELSA